MREVYCKTNIKDGREAHVTKSNSVRLASLNLKL